MGIYLLTAGVAILLSWIIKTNKERGVREIINGILLTILIVGLAFIVGFRWNVGTDYWDYKRMFEIYKDYSWGDIFALKEPGIRLIVKFVSLFTDGDHWYFFLCALITVGLPVITIYRHSENFLLSITFYLFINYLGIFNGMRQCLAMAIIFSGYGFIKRKKFWYFLILVLIGSIFHSSAFFCIPIYFIYTCKPSWRSTAIIILGTLFLRFSYDIIGDAVGFFQEGEFETSNYYQNSVSLLRVVAMAFPLILVTPLKGNMIKEKSFAVHMLLANACVYVCMAESAYFSRLGMFTDMFLCMAIPSVLKKYGPKDRAFIIFVMVLCYALFFYVSLTSNADLTPYTTIWQSYA